MPKSIHVETTSTPAIHTVLAGINVLSLRRAQYFVAFIDEVYGNVKASNIKAKREAGQILKPSVCWTASMERFIGLHRFELKKEYDIRSKDVYPNGIEVSPTYRNTTQ